MFKGRIVQHEQVINISKSVTKSFIKSSYITGKRESILLHYDTVLQHFTGFITFAMIFTKKVVSQFVPVHHIPAVVTVVVLYMSYRLASMPTNSKL